MVLPPLRIPRGQNRFRPPQKEVADAEKALLETVVEDDTASSSYTGSDAGHYGLGTGNPPS